MQILESRSETIDPDLKCAVSLASKIGLEHPDLSSQDLAQHSVNHFLVGCDVLSFPRLYSPMVSVCGQCLDLFPVQGWRLPPCVPV
mgnify:CR=1 FL=1